MVRPAIKHLWVYVKFLMLELFAAAIRAQESELISKTR